MSEFEMTRGSPEVSVFHVIGCYPAQGHFKKRLEFLLESVDRADRAWVRLFASAPPGWARDGWELVSLERDARRVGDPGDKPFIKDLLDQAGARASSRDWLLYTNCDVGLAPDIYTRLRNVRGSAVEYMRREVDGDPETLEELFTNPGEPTGSDSTASHSAPASTRSSARRFPTFSSANRTGTLRTPNSLSKTPNEAT